MNGPIPLFQLQAFMVRLLTTLSLCPLTWPNTHILHVTDVQTEFHSVMAVKTI